MPSKRYAIYGNRATPGAKYTARKRAQAGYNQFPEPEEALCASCQEEPLEEMLARVAEEAETAFEIEQGVRQAEADYELRKQKRAPSGPVIDQIEDFYKVIDWPSFAQNLYKMKHRNNPNRFALWLFLWRNGMEPFKAAHWSVFPPEEYDASAHRQVSWLAKEALLSPEKFDKYRTYVMNEEAFS